jgi:NADH:ubiquinone reductase (H+-translocating)
MQHLVIIGGGFAGMWAALTSARELVKAGDGTRVTLLARDGYLGVRPRFYEPFSEGLRAPLAPVLGPLGIHLEIGVAHAINPQQRTVEVRGERSNMTLRYDRLVLAVGSEQRALGIPGADEFAFSIDTFATAQVFDEHLRKVVRANQPGAATFVVVGAGFTGIELATEMRDRIRLHSDDKTAQGARVILIERAKVVGPDLGANPRPTIETALKNTRVEVSLDTTITKIEQDAITLANGERIATATVVVTAGLRANPIATQIGAELDPQGRVIVDNNLRANTVAEIFAAGDIAHAHADEAHLALMSCQHAVPMGKYAGYNAAHDLMGSPLRAYSQPNYVTVLDLGSWGAVFTMGWDRKVEQQGPEVKALKKMVNTQWIYPPSGDRAALLEAADLDAPWPPKV